MKVPISWIKDFVDIEIPIEELAKKMTMAGLEVEEIIYVGLPMPFDKVDIGSGGHLRHETKISGIEWDPDYIVVGEIQEVMPHPNADRLVLCRLYDGERDHILLTGAPNLFPYKGKGPLDSPLKVAYAREGAQLFDGHQAGQVLMTLKRAKIRGVESYSMACSEKELGISDDHEVIIILDSDAEIGKPLVDYMGDAVLDVAITPNIARDANIIGMAREIAALTGQQLNLPDLDLVMEGESIQGKVAIEIQEPELNPRFVLGLVEGIEIHASPYEIQRRLTLAGMRPINNIVDATNYAMLEQGEPLHAFDYDILRQRAKGESPTIITRTASAGEQIITLDDITHTLDDFTVLVCDTAGPLSIAGIMGGVESEVNQNTRNVLLEGAAWNFTNIRRTLTSQKMSSEAAYRFSRGVHPALAERGVRRGLELMRLWAGGTIAQGLVDNYPLPPSNPPVEFNTKDIERWLGINIPIERISEILESLEFSVQVVGRNLIVTAPDHRLDIGEGIIGVADLMEEIARVYGYDNIPETRISDQLPKQKGNPKLEFEETLRDYLRNLGLQEVITHRLTTPERESRATTATEAQNSGPEDRRYVRIANPITSDRTSLRRSLLASLLEVGERNAKIAERLAIFEIGKVFLPAENELLPQEPRRIAILLSGPRNLPTWQINDQHPMDFFDIKGLLGELLNQLHMANVTFEPSEHPSFHPGKCARVKVTDLQIGVLGEIHPLVKENYEFNEYPVVAAEIDVEALAPLVPGLYNLEPVPVYPPVLEDLSLVVDENVPAQRVADSIEKAGGSTVTKVTLFDVYRGGQAGSGKKSLAFSLTYQHPDRTLTDDEVAKIRNKIINQLEQELNAQLRS